LDETANDARTYDVTSPIRVNNISTINRVFLGGTGSSRSINSVQSEEEAPLESNSPKAKKNPGGRALLYPELPWGAPPGWQDGRNRGHSFLIVWDCAIFLCCLYVAGAVPFELGILDSIKRFDSHNFPSLHMAIPASNKRLCTLPSSAPCSSSVPGLLISKHLHSLQSTHSAFLAASPARLPGPLSSEDCWLRQLFYEGYLPSLALTMATLDLIVDFFFTADIVLHFYQARMTGVIQV
jgi:hypothetical protein